MKSDCVIEVRDAIKMLTFVSDADLILTDPPYAISMPGGNRFPVGPNSCEHLDMPTDFGEWDHVEIDVSELARYMYNALRKGGSAVVFYDIWKFNKLADAMRDAGFVQLRFLEWVKTNPVPINSKATYLSNGREVAVSAVKGGKSTFNSQYDLGLYKCPIPQNPRLHPTQKPVELFKTIIAKHSDKGDLVIDPYLGSGTTAEAALALGRRFQGCDISEEFVSVAKSRIEGLTMPLLDVL